MSDLLKPTPSIVYVEDDLPSRVIMNVLLGRIIKTSPFYIFEDSRDFLSRLAGLPFIPDIVLLDVQVTPDDGYTLLHLLRAETRYANVKIVASTASVTTADVNRMQTAKFDGLIGKPLDLHTFMDSITRIMAGDAVWSTT